MAGCPICNITTRTKDATTEEELKEEGPAVASMAMLATCIRYGSTQVRDDCCAEHQKSVSLLLSDPRWH